MADKSGGYAITIKAVDQTTATIDKINNKLADMQRKAMAPVVEMRKQLSAPLTQLGKSIGKFFETTGISKFGRALGGIMGRLKGLAGLAMRALGPLGALLGGGIGALLWKSTQAWAQYGHSILMTSTAMGITTQQAQRMRQTGRIMGLGPDALAQAGVSLEDTMQAAVMQPGGREAQILKQAGINPQGAARFQGREVQEEDYEKIASDIQRRRKAGASTATIRQLYGGIVGQDVLSTLMQGPQYVKQAMEQAEKSVKLGDEQVQAAEKENQLMGVFNNNLEQLNIGIGSVASKAINPLIDSFNNMMDPTKHLTELFTQLGDQLTKLIPGLGGDGGGGDGTGGDGKTLNTGGIMSAISSMMWPMLTRFTSIFQAGSDAISDPKGWFEEWKKAFTGGSFTWGGQQAPNATPFSGGGGAAAPNAAQPQQPGFFGRVWNRMLYGPESIRNQAAGTGGSGKVSFAQPSADVTMTPERRAFLDTVADRESGGDYSVMYGGKHFDDFSQHPGGATLISSGPNAGLTSSAAGRYQFIGSTWRAQQAKLGLKDFSPENQDKAAWDLAATNYQRATGRSLDEDLKDPKKLPAITAALHGTWTSLPGGIEQTTSNDDFAKRLLAHQQSEKSRNDVARAKLDINLNGKWPEGTTTTASTYGDMFGKPNVQFGMASAFG